MAGGLLQLIIKGVLDIALTFNPEITFFKIVYKKYTNFIICQNNKYLGNHNNNKEYSIILDKIGDMLYNQYFKISIPFFNLENSIVNSQIIDNGYDISSLKINYFNLECIVYYNINWYIVPIKLFKLLLLNKSKSKTSSNIFITLLKNFIYNNNLDFYFIKYDTIKKIIPVIDDLLIYSNIWHQIWLLDIINNKRNNQLLTYNSYYNNLYLKLNTTIYTNYYLNYLHKKNKKYFNFNDIYGKSEVEKYFEYINNAVTTTTTVFDIDILYNYCIKNNYIFNDYIENTKYNSMIILLILSLLYSTDNLIFSFWKNYTISNNINDNIYESEYYYFKNEWKRNLYNYINIIFINNDINTLTNNYILNIFKEIYFDTTEKIIDIFYNTAFNNTKVLYIKLKKIHDRFYLIPYSQLNFNNSYHSTLYTVNIAELNTNDSYNNNITNTDLVNYNNLISNFNNLKIDERLNLVPVDLQNIYGIIAYDLIELEFTLNIYDNIKSFLILWRNNVLLRLYKRHLDTYKLVSNNANLFNFKINRKTNLYYSIYPSNLFLYKDFIYSYYEMFYKNSWICNINNDELELLNNINLINIKNITVVNGKFNIYETTNKKLFNLQIQNSYDITSNNYYYDKINNCIYIKYYNNYNDNCNLKLYNNDKLIKYIKIEYKYYSDINIEGMCLLINLKDIIEFINIKILITYSSFLPIVAFYKESYKYPQHIINKYILLSKNINNIINKNNININSSILNNSIKILNIEYNNNKIYKTVVYLEIYNFLYILKDTNNIIINFPEDFTDIKEIYLTEYNLINNIITDFTYNENKIKLISNYSSDYYYYLINKYNNKEFYKLIPSRKGIAYNNLKINNKNKYSYIYTYYNTNEHIESKPSEVLTLYKNANNVTLFNFTINNNISYSKIRIYRTKSLENEFYLLDELDKITKIYIDTKLDENLNEQYILNNLAESLFLSICSWSINSNTYSYNYKISYSNNNIESLISDVLTVNIDDNNIILSFDIKLIPSIYNSVIVYKLKDDKYYKLTTFNNSTEQFIDNNILNQQYEDTYLYCTNDIINITLYKIISIKSDNIVPNLNSFISHSTNINYTNDKNLSDINDYIFNKSFIILNKTGNIFNTDILNFYNIPFKICPNSIITLDNININYMIPISTEQYFIYEDTDNYYTLNESKYTQINKYNILQLKFSPAFDEYHIDFDYLKITKIEKIIDTMVNKIHLLINNNIDYKITNDLLISMNEEYINIFTSTFNSIDGNTSKYILESLYQNNKINTNNNIILYDLLNYSNIDYLNYSHYAVNLTFNNSDLFNFNNINNINLLTPINNSYNSYYKISNNLIVYLTDIVNYFKEHINYININKDYLILSNPINYKNSYSSYSEITEYNTSKFNNIKTNYIKVLYPIIDDTIYKIHYNNIYYALHSINNETRNLYINDFNYCIEEDKYNDANICITDRRNNKFEYLGIVNINTFNNKNLDSKYYKFDDNKIYKITYINNYNTVNTILKNFIVTNPTEIILNDENILSIVPTFINNKYIYIIELQYNIKQNIVSFYGNFIINNNLLNGYYKYIDSYSSHLILITDNNINILENTIFYNHDNIWNTINNIKTITVKLYNNINYSFVDTENILKNVKILEFNNEYHIIESISKSTINNINTYYFNLISNSQKINIYYDVTTILHAPIIIKNNIIYPVTDINILNYDNTYYILLIDFTNIKYYIINIFNITNIETSNYHCWIYKQSYLNLFEYKIEGSIKNNIIIISTFIPKYSFYCIKDKINNKEYIIYYDNDFNMNNYIIPDQIIDNIYLIDNSLFNNEYKQLFNILKTIVDTSKNILFNKTVLDNNTNIYYSTKYNIGGNIINNDEKLINFISQIKYIYQYKISYYNSELQIESSLLDYNIIVSSDNIINDTQQIILYNFEYNKHFDMIKIYRTKANNNIYYLLSNITGTTYTDTKLDSTLVDQYIKTNIYNSLPKYLITNSNNVYNYKFIYYNSKTNIYSDLSNKLIITVLYNINKDNHIILSNLYINNQYDLIKIYRTKTNENIYYIVNSINTNFYIDNKADNELVDAIQDYNIKPLLTIDIITYEYQYIITFYNTITNLESNTSDILIIKCNLYDKIMLHTFDTIDKLLYDNIKIYRTKKNQNIFYYVGITNLNSYIDNSLDDNLTIKYIDKKYLIDIPFIINDILLEYNYFITYFNEDTLLESLPSNILNIKLSFKINSNNSIKIFNFGDININNKIKIYRSKSSSSNFYLLDIVNRNQYIDIKQDEELNILYKKSTLLDKNNSILSYNIITYIYKYRVQYNNNCLSEIKEITTTNYINSNNNISIKLFAMENIKIYRTKANKNIFYLLNKENIYENIYIDNILDSNLDIIYTEANIPKYQYKLINYNYKYKYKFSYYNTISLKESFISEEIIYELKYCISEKNTLNITNIIFNEEYNSIKIYRTKYDSDIFYYVDTTVLNTYIDKISDDNLINILFVPNIPLKISYNKKNKYSYKLSFYNTSKFIESELSSNLEIESYDINNNNYITLINIENINIKYDSIKIYRTQKNSNNYYLVGTTNQSQFIDNISDELLTMQYNLNLDIINIKYNFKSNNYNYKYFFTHYDILNNYESRISNIISINIDNPISDINTLQLSNIINTVNTNFTIKIYRTKQNTNDFYYINTIHNISYIDNNIDTLLINKFNKDIYLQEKIHKYEIMEYIYIYKYKFTFYNSITNIESNISDGLILNLSHQIDIYNNILISELMNINTNYNNIKIYRTKSNEDIYYLLKITNNISFIDNIEDIKLNQIFEKTSDVILYTILPKYIINNIKYIYKYRFSYYNLDTLIESELSDVLVIRSSLINKINTIKLTDFNTTYNRIKIYRTKANEEVYFYIGYVTANMFIDNILDTDLITIYETLNISISFNIKQINNYIYHPLIVKSSENYNIQNISFDININDITTSYKNSLIPIYYNSNIIYTNKLINNGLNELYITDYICIGSINLDNNIYSMNHNMIIQNKYIYIKKSALTSFFQLWKIQVEKLYYIYFWTLYTDNKYITELYLKLNLNKAEPYYINNIETYKYNLILCYPDIFIKNENGLIINDYNMDISLNYKYYSNKCSINNFQIKNIDFNNILNIKPKIELYTNTNIFDNLNKVIYYIVVFPEYIYIYYNNEYDKMITDIYNKKVSIYISLKYPYYITNSITIYKYNNIYIISNYNKLYLEMNEIIAINGIYFKILGLNTITQNYEAINIRNNPDNIIKNNNGYYTLGVYIHNENKIIPELSVDTTIIYNKSKNIKKGHLYYSNFKLNMALLDTTMNNIFTFNNDDNILIKLYYQNSKLYIIDNYIKIKKFDILIYENIQIIITDINNGELQYILDNNLLLDNILSDNTFITFYLPYQPFDIYYIILVNGHISNITLNNSDFVICNIYNTQNIDIYKINDNKIYSKNNVLLNVTDNIWIKYLNTDYKYSFDNIYTLPKSDIINYTLNNHPIEIHAIKLLNNFIINSNIFDKYIFYYLQPIYICGNYNFIIDIININDIYIIKLKYTVNTIFNDITIYISPYHNNIDYYSDYKFNYNMSIQPLENNILPNSKIIKYSLKNDKLIYVENLTINVLQDLKDDNNNNITYTNLYFYNYYQIDINTAEINNSELIIGKYYLLVEKTENIDIIYLIKIENNNKLLFYSDMNITDNIYYINKIIPCKININNEYTLCNMKIIQVKQILNKNENNINIIYKYSIKYINTIIYENNIYKQQIEIINNNYLLLNSINKIYFELNDISYDISIIDNKFYILSDKIIFYDKNIIYIKITNSILYSNNDYTNILPNNNLHDIINNYKYELYTFNITIQKNISTTNNYYYSSIDDIFKLNIINNYYLYEPYILINYIDQTNMINLYESIDNDILEYSKESITSKIWIKSNINNNNIYDTKKIFDDIKQLKYKLFLNSKININNLLFINKPWEEWSLFITLYHKKLNTSILYNSNKLYLKWFNNSCNILFNKEDIYYITKNDYINLSNFLYIINTNSISKTNYYILKNKVEPLIYENINRWINNPYFYMNVLKTINEFLYNNFGSSIYFDNNNILFINESPVYIKDTIELANYITDEYIYNDTENIIYRSEKQINKIVDSFNSDIYDNYGISIHKLLRSLKILGDEFIKIYNDTDITKNYDYNNPFKYFINKIWNSNNDKITNNNFTDKLILVDNQKDYSGILLTNDLNIEYYGIYSMLKLKLLNNINEYNNIYSKNITYISNNLYNYSFNFLLENISNTYFSYSILNNKYNISNINIIDPIINQNQITINNNYKIEINDFIIITQSEDYNIKNTKFIGNIYRLTSSNNIFNFNFITEIKYNDNNIAIHDKTLNYIDIIINNNILDKLINIITYIGINDYYYKNNKCYINLTNSINFINNQTYISINNNIFILFLTDDTYYIEYTDDIIISDIKIINIINLNIEYELYTITEIEIDSIDSDKYYFNFNKNIIFIEDKTYIIIDNIKYKLYYSNLLYYVNITNIISINVILINIIIFNNINNNLTVYSYELDSLFNNNLFNNLDIKLLSNDIFIDYSSIAIFKNIITVYYLKNTINTNITKIVYNKKINIKNINKINDIINTNEYLYYIYNDISLLILNTSKIIIFNKNLLENITLDIINNILNSIHNISLNCYTKNNIINIILNNLIEDISEYSFILINTWNISYVRKNNNIIFDIPSDFVLSHLDNYYYKINDKFIDSHIFNNTTVTLDFSISDKLILQQIYIEYKPNIYIPTLNIKYKININNSYSDTNNLFIIPYDILDNLYPFLYKIESLELINLSNCKDIYLYFKNYKYNGIVYNSELNIIALQDYINTSYNYICDINDNIYNLSNIIYHNNILSLVEYYDTYDLNNIYIFSSNIIIPNKFILYLASYTKYDTIDNNIELHKSMEKSITKIDNNIILHKVPIWKNSSNFFEYIQLFFNDQLIEEINPDIFNINYYLYKTEESRKQIDNQIKIRLNDNNWELYIPLLFWFSKKAELALPLVALQYTEIKIKYKINNFSELIFNYNNEKINEKIKINLISDYILLDEEERLTFGSIKHTYLINNYCKQQTKFIDSTESILNYKLTGLIKDIYIITKLLDDKNLTFYPEYINDYDYKYNIYMICLKYINDNIYISETEYKYNIDIFIIKNNIIEYNNYTESSNKAEFIKINKLLSNFSSLKYWNKDLLLYLMYYIDKYLLNNSNKYYLLSYYLQYQYCNNVLTNEIHLLEKLKISIGNIDIFTGFDNIYFNNVVPYTKYYNSLPTGYYVYTFSLNPIDDQPSGHINFTSIDNTVLSIKSYNQKYNLHLITKDYNIIRIMSGIGSLTWF